MKIIYQMLYLTEKYPNKKIAWGMHSTRKIIQIKCLFKR